MFCLKCNYIECIQLLAGDKFMPEMHLIQPRFTHSACGPFTRNKERIQKFKEMGDTKHIYKIVYIDKLDDIVNEYNNTYHKTIKMKLIGVKDKHILTLIKKLMIKILNFKLVIT